MPRDINKVIENLKDEPENMPIELYQIYLDEDTLYLACFPYDVEFFDENGNPQTYQAAALSRGSVKTTADTKVDTTQVSIDNVTREMSAYIANTEFVSRRLVIWKVFRDDLSDPQNYISVFDGYMDSPEINQYSMSVSVVSKLDTLDKKLPGRIFQVKCSWVFGSKECGIVVPKKSGVVETYSSSWTPGNFQVSIKENLTSDKWEHGQITINGFTSNITYVSTENDYVRLETPIPDISIGDSYEMRAGCDKSYNSGHGCTFWRNTQFYGGFLSIPKIKDIREV